MLLDSTPLLHGSETSLRDRALHTFLSFLEEKFDASFVRDMRRMPYGRPDLLEEFRIAERLVNAKVISRLFRFTLLPDEPPYKRWAAICNNQNNHRTSGTSLESDADALRATLAEALERYLWMEARDYFVKPKRASTLQMRRGLAPFIPPERFIGFADADRKKNPNLQFKDDDVYLWIRGTSLVSGKAIYLPAQTVSGIRAIRTEGRKPEPLIRLPITTGLATWPTREYARLAGALEVIERDAYMIMWYNQLTLPRVSLDDVCERLPSLKKLVTLCKRYRLKPHCVRMLTDAPAHTICAILEDESGVAPRFGFGLKAKGSLAEAVEGALFEALRGRALHRLDRDRWKFTSVDEIGHIDRIHFWADPVRAKQLEFLIQGPEKRIERQDFEDLSPEEHLRRIVEWCRIKGYECVAVSLGTSRLNPLPWHVEYVVIPELQPTHLHERVRQTGGARLHDIPKQFGYTPLTEPHIATPHPFA